MKGKKKPQDFKITYSGNVGILRVLIIVKFRTVISQVSPLVTLMVE